MFKDGKEYQEIKFQIGSSIERAVNDLLKYNNSVVYRIAGIKAYGDFNGTILYSDTVTMDSAYLQIVGKTKAEFDEEQKKIKESIEKRELEHKQNLPNLTKFYIKKAQGILKSNKLKEWNRIVPIRLNDLYEGMELKCTLDIGEILNKSNSFNDAKAELNNQGHSGLSYSLVCTMIKDFCNRGEEFIKYLHEEQ
jgi:hypothetical protein